jgi:2-succinyl-6-hydroxy-2,4-cyclohexadiene-1-carboxylate synthase
VVELLAGLQDRVFEGPAAWLGYSMGARIALAAAVEGVPGTALLLESGSPGLADPLARAERRIQDEERARRLESEGIESFVDDWLRLPLFRGLRQAPPEVRAAARATRIAQDPARMAACLREGGTGVQPSLWDRLSEIRRPVRLVVGVKDEKFVTVARAMVDRLPDVALREIPGVGHTVHLEAPDSWVRWVRDALSDVHPPGTPLPSSPEP